MRVLFLALFETLLRSFMPIYMEVEVSTSCRAASMNYFDACCILQKQLPCLVVAPLWQAAQQLQQTHNCFVCFLSMDSRSCKLLGSFESSKTSAKSCLAVFACPASHSYPINAKLRSSCPDSCFQVLWRVEAAQQLACDLCGLAWIVPSYFKLVACAWPVKLFNSYLNSHGTARCKQL